MALQLLLVLSSHCKIIKDEVYAGKVFLKDGNMGLEYEIRTSV
jgi:hypothetical protein